MTENHPQIIIPAAGFGRRNGRPEAKELFLSERGKPLIEFALDQGRSRNWPIHVITRKEKQSLIHYLEDYRRQYQVDLNIQLVEPTREWPDSILQSQKYWKEKNILCLPDTVFKPSEILDDMNASLEKKYQAVFAVFAVEDPHLWGVVKKIADNEFELCEKPRNFLSKDAWGIIGFKKNIGENLFQNLLSSTFEHHNFKIKFPVEMLRLYQFQDLTRL